MTYDEAAELLTPATRSELRDHAFGDREVFWVKDGVEIAYGYLGDGRASVWFRSDCMIEFNDEEARKLSQLGSLGEVSRNDETGPDAYSEGTTMPGLTLEGVREELTGQ